jgi:RNA polymerase sigma-70 factor (ECF subfamily)
MSLYHIYSPRVFGSALSILKDKQEAEDAMQEAFLKAFTKMDTYSASAPFESWLRRIVINEAITVYRKRKARRYIPVEETPPSDDRLRTPSAIEKMMVFDKVSQALARLKENYRLALTLFLIEEYNYREISQCMDISYANSRTLVSRAKQELRNELAKL